MLWKPDEARNWPDTSALTMRFSGWLFRPRPDRHTLALALAAYLIGSAGAMAVPIPSSSTASQLDMSVSLAGVQLTSVPATTLETNAQTATAATGLDPLGGVSAHLASTDSDSTIQPRGNTSILGEFPLPEPIYSISMRAETLAESLWTGPMGARARAAGSAGFSNFNVTAMPGATLTLDWNFGELRLESTPLASLSTIEHMVSITLDSHAEPGGTPRVLSGGFSAVTRDGETHWTALDFPGSTAISDWLAALKVNDISPFTSPLKGPSLTLPLVTASPGPSPAPRDLTIAVDVRLQGFSIEAPLAPVKPVAERAGSLDTGAMTHWDAARQRLSFDRLPLNLLLDARGSPMADQRNPDPLSDAYLEIDPLLYTGAFDAEGFFVGTGNVRLVAADGEILFEVPLSGLAYDERLYELEGFNLFGPLLGAAPLTGSESQWLSAFFRRVNGATFYLPELFIDIGMPAQLAAGSSRWRYDFTSPVSASLSFAGPQPVSLPGSSALVLIGLLFLARMRSTRGA